MKVVMLECLNEEYDGGQSQRVRTASHAVITRLMSLFVHGFVSSRDPRAQP